MEIQLQDVEAKLYRRLQVSSLDFDFAQYCVGVILKRHYQPWEKRGTIYLQQSAFMSAFVIACQRRSQRAVVGRNFLHSLRSSTARKTSFTTT